MLTQEVRPLVQRHVSAHAEGNQIALQALNVQMEHVHALIDLLSSQTVENIVKLLKGESSHWINEQNVIAQRFSWQRGYAAFSLSPSHCQRVKSYINDQDEHYRRKTFAEEYRTLLGKYGFSETETHELVCAST